MAVIGMGRKHHTAGVLRDRRDPCSDSLGALAAWKLPVLRGNVSAGRKLSPD